MVTGTSGRLG